MSAGDVTSVWMCFKLRPYCRGALGTGLLDVGEMPYPNTCGCGKNCFFRSFHRFSCCAHSRIVKFVKTDQSRAWLHTCMERGTLSNSRVVNFSFPVSLALEGVPDAGVHAGSVTDEGLEARLVSSTGTGFPPNVEGLGWLSGTPSMSNGAGDVAAGDVAVGVCEVAGSPSCDEAEPAFGLVAFRLIS